MDPKSDPPVRHAKSSQIPGARHPTSAYQGTGVDEPEALDLALQISKEDTGRKKQQRKHDFLRRRAILAKHGVSEEDALARAIERSKDPAKNDPTATHGHHPDLVAPPIYMSATEIIHARIMQTADNWIETHKDEIGEDRIEAARRFYKLWLTKKLKPGVDRGAVIKDTQKRTMKIFSRKAAAKKESRLPFRFKANPILQFKQLRRDVLGKGAPRQQSVQRSKKQLRKERLEEWEKDILRPERDPSPEPSPVPTIASESSSISSFSTSSEFKPGFSRFEIPTPVYPRSIASTESSELTSISVQSGLHTPQRRPEPVLVDIKRRQLTKTRAIKKGKRLFQERFAEIGEAMWEERAAGPPPIPIGFVDAPAAQEVVAHAQIQQLPPDVALPRWSQLRFVPGDARITDAGNAELFHVRFLDKGGIRASVAISGGMVHIRPKSVKIIVQKVSYATRKELTDFLLGRFPVGGIIDTKTYSNVRLPVAVIKKLPGTVLVTY